MTRLFGLTLLFGALALAGAPADAQHCAARARAVYVAPTYHYGQSYYQAQTYHAPTYYPTVTQLVVPAYYYVGYTPGGGEAQLQIDLLKLKNELLQLRLDQSQQLKFKAPDKVEAVQTPQPQGQQQIAGARLKLFAAKCAACHDGAANKGGGLSLTAGGQLAPLDYDSALAVNHVLYVGKTRAGKAMPPDGSQLADAEVGPALVDVSPKKQ